MIPLKEATRNGSDCDKLCKSLMMKNVKSNLGFCYYVHVHSPVYFPLLPSFDLLSVHLSSGIWESVDESCCQSEMGVLYVQF